MHHTQTVCEAQQSRAGHASSVVQTLEENAQIYFIIETHLNNLDPNPSDIQFVLGSLQ